MFNFKASTGDFMQEKQITDEKVLRRDYERLRIGHELARAVGSELDLEKLLPKILDKAFELVGADRGVILLTDDRTNEMTPRFVKTRSGKSDPNIVDADRSFVPGKPELRVNIDRQRAADLGVRVADIATTLNVMLAGVVLNFVCIGIALAGVDVPNFWAALFLLGVGWNFLYIGATALLTETYRPAEKAKAQGANDLVIFLIMATSSFSSGLLLETNGWQLLNYLAIPFVAVIGVAVLWLMTKRRVPAAA